MTAGVLLLATGRLIEPYILVWLGALLFLNLLRLNSSDLVAVFKKPKQIAVLSIIKIVALPAGMYLLAYVIYEPFCSTGPAPFWHFDRPWRAICCKPHRRPASSCDRHDNCHLSCSAIRLPSIVYALARSQFEISLLHMMFLLSIHCSLLLQLAGLPRSTFLQVQSLQTRIRSIYR